MAKHKCEGCIHKGQHQEMGFKPFGVCLLENNLIEAEKKYNVDKCPYKKPKTNADRIRNMTDTELADFVTNIHQREIDEFDYIYIVEGNMLEEYDDILIWLQAEVEEGAE